MSAGQVVGPGVAVGSTGPPGGAEEDVGAGDGAVPVSLEVPGLGVVVGVRVEVGGGVVVVGGGVAGAVELGGAVVRGACWVAGGGAPEPADVGTVGGRT